MSRRSLPLLTAGLALLVAAAALPGAPAQGVTPKRGGVLNTVLIEDPPGLIIHESATVSNVWPMMPCYSTLVLFDPLRPLDTAACFPALARREFQIAANLTAGGFDDPDAYLIENYTCGSSRNYSDYCSEAMDRRSSSSPRSWTGRNGSRWWPTSSARSRPRWRGPCWAGARSTSPSSRT